MPANQISRRALARGLQLSPKSPDLHEMTPLPSYGVVDCPDIIAHFTRPSIPYAFKIVILVDSLIGPRYSSVRIDSGSLAVHAYRRSWNAGPTSLLISTAGFFASTKNFGTGPMRMQ